MSKKLTRHHTKHGTHDSTGVDRLELAAIGLESEFSLLLNGQPVRPEDTFRSPKDFMRGNPMHRVGSSYHLPTGGAIYFDTGVIEIATPVIEIERGCAARAGRSLWEGIRYLRTELDAWERTTKNRINLVGFSTHYNVSFELDETARRNGKSVEKLALLLTYILPIPVMLLATNKRSTGVGVRPRGNRIEITADFTPSAELMIAAATFITGVVRSVMEWPTFELSELARFEIPVVERFSPIPHTSRKGWLAKNVCYASNPFEIGVNEVIWQLRSRSGRMALRQIAEEIFQQFWRPIARISDPFTFRLIQSIMDGSLPSLLALRDRPVEYEDVGRLCDWDDLFPESVLRRSRYERVLMHAIAGDELLIDGDALRPTGMQGWSKVVFRRRGDNASHIFPIDYLVRHLDSWHRRAS